MPLPQAEADQLLSLPKIFVDTSPIEFTLNEPMDHERVLHSTDRREEFILTVERGNRTRLRLKYQTLARKVIVLARLDLNGKRHRNPPDASYRPAEWLPGTHLHLYREGFDDRIAYLIEEAPGWSERNVTDGIAALEAFLLYCTVQSCPPIQTAL